MAEVVGERILSWELIRNTAMKKRWPGSMCDFCSQLHYFTICLAMVILLNIEIHPFISMFPFPSTTVDYQKCNVPRKYPSRDERVGEMLLRGQKISVGGTESREQLYTTVTIVGGVFHVYST